ncbi:IclR family transcriptional regulator [Mycolicibacterium mageritense DSM 44476 = CIP 104973]|uniref:IclR family transcriptional regulator n=1 Tax=Mycolicibacterium mageritense TaxID=53462 RepID=A0AAI8TQE5_MYCME|nr:IclR family transcriptional regulator [Mycolicibacterium mageritense]MCC9184458.1 IclR family transcriptional regulator [Mycolicibacterium mageritense]TXI63977.1 MAG: IclR family transcriptional regulator [Mycolicibacterium mageritense]CDO23138.1 IclR family transcriptional regulator [Mycolicibacterium mageritense DSM 44476 = CIP 104973]BBX32320.1 IclR family transcriptional regulator [Mycolicibacterium mageritense]BDY28998.1 Pca regulon regulatory protein [Mycolicibacterium mageritense]
MATPDGKPTSNMRSLERAFDVLAVLQEAKQPLRLSEVGRACGLHIATVQRILNVLLDRGYAARTGDAYTAGPAALAVAHAFMVTSPLNLLAQTTLQQLAASTGYTASLYVRVENSRVLVARVESGSPLSYVLPVGERLPLYLGSAGKIFLAEMARGEIEAILPDSGRIDLASGKSITKDELFVQLEEIRMAGHAVSVSERNYGIASITAPVRSADGALAAVLGVTGPADELSDSQVARLITEVRRAAAALGARIPDAG